MEPATSGTVAGTGMNLGLLGDRIRAARKERGLTQEQLAGPEFTKGYVSALERGSVRPSLKTLDVFSRRLGIPMASFLAAPQPDGVDLDVAAIEEDLRYQTNYALMLIRSGQVDEALNLIAEAEKYAGAYLEKISPRVRYLIPFTRARAYVQRGQPALAAPELDAALEVAGDDAEAEARVRNLLGVVYYEQEQPQFAVHQHAQCLRAVRNASVKDPNLRLSIYHNLAADYLALREVPQAIEVFQEALKVLEDLNDMERQAGVFWGLAMAYKEDGDWKYAKLYAQRALHIYEAAQSKIEAASICMHMAEILIEEERYEEAEQFLEQAKEFTAGVGSKGIMSYLNQDYSTLARRQGRIKQAAEYANEAVKLAEEFRETVQANVEQPSNQPWLNSTRTYADALHAAALIEEAQGRTKSADKLFQRALDEIRQTGVEESIRNITFSYAETLKARGEFEKAVEFYRSVAQGVPRSSRLGAG